MVIYLIHPRHGNKVACSEAEAKYDETKGWKRSGVKVAPPEPVKVVEVENVALIHQRYQEKFGKKPHHKKSLATIKAELSAMGPFANRAP